MKQSRHSHSMQEAPVTAPLHVSKRHLLLSVCLIMFTSMGFLSTSCSKEADNLYANHPAYFVCKYTQNIAALNTALNSTGIYSTIRYDRGVFRFTTNLGQTSQTNATAIEAGANIQMGIAGFIVGCPPLPEMGSNTSRPVCYDLACPNCYKDFNISRTLTLTTGGQAHCSSCQRTYELNNYVGEVCQGEAGEHLFRYNVNYSSGTLVINNR